MTALEEEFARIPEEVRLLIGAVRLEVPELEDGSPSPPSPAVWASALFAATPPPAAPPALEPLPPLRVEPDEVEIEEVASIDLGPVSVPEPEEASEPEPLSARARAALAAGLVAAGALCWLGWTLRAFTVPIPASSLAAAAGRADGGIAAAQGAGVKFYDRGGRETGSLTLEKAPSSIAWDSGFLYVVDGSGKRVQRWGDAAAAPDAYALDHAPRTIFVRAPYLWTVDADGAYLRQYLMTESMNGSFFQQLDSLKLPDIKTRDLFITKGGRVITIEAETGRLLSLSPEKNALVLEKSDDFLPAYARTSAHLLASDGPLRLTVPNESGDETKVLRYRGILDFANR